MDDLINRQAAIDALRDYLVGKRCPDDGTLTCRLIENEVINKLPTIHSKLSTNLAEVSTDCISRKAAINAIDECYCGGEDSCGEPWIYQENAVEAIQMIEPILPTEPQIIRCKDCIYSGTPDEEKWRLCHHDGAQWNEENHFCGYAERRTE